MRKIITVTGEIAPEELGVTSMHEHTLHDAALLTKVMLCGTPDMLRGVRSYENGSDIRAERQRRQDSGITVPSMSVAEVLRSMRLKKGSPAAKLTQEQYYREELALFALHGGSALCDCSPLLPGCAYLSQIQELSRQTGVLIVTAAGYYTKPMIPKKDFLAGEGAMQRQIEQMLGQGDPRSGVRCGFVKAAIGTVAEGVLSPWELTAVRAAARAAKHYGVSLHIHTAFPVRKAMVLSLAATLEHEIGLDPQKVVFCHMDSYNVGVGNPAACINAEGYDLTLPRELCRRGFNIGLDTWGVRAGKPETDAFMLAARKSMLLALLAEGFAGQITLGHDMMSVGSGAQNGGGGYLLWPDTLARMRKNGQLTEEAWHLLAVENPARILTAEG